MDVLLSDDDDDDLAVFRAVEEGQTLRWSGFNACDVTQRQPYLLKSPLHFTLDGIARAGSSTLMIRGLKPRTVAPNLFSSPNWICLARHC